MEYHFWWLYYAWRSINFQTGVPWGFSHRSNRYLTDILQYIISITWITRYHSYHLSATAFNVFETEDANSVTADNNSDVSMTFEYVSRYAYRDGINVHCRSMLQHLSTCWYKVCMIRNEHGQQSNPSKHLIWDNCLISIFIPMFPLVMDILVKIPQGRISSNWDSKNFH